MEKIINLTTEGRKGIKNIKFKTTNKINLE